MRIFSPNLYDRSIKTIEEIAHYLYSGDKPLTGHISIGAYTDELIQYSASNGNSVAQYNGVMNGTIIPIDFDLRIDKLEEEAVKVNCLSGDLLPRYLDQSMLILQPILEEWDTLGIEYYYFFSGNKGFTIYLSSAHLMNKEIYEERFDLLCKSTIDLLRSKYPTLNNNYFLIDTQPYNRVGMLRAPFTEHEKSKKNKYMLIPKVPKTHGLMSSYNQVGKVWQESKKIYPQILKQIFSEKQPSSIILGVLQDVRATTVTQEIKVYTKPYLMEHCIWTMWKNSLSSSQGREVTGMRIASWASKRGLTPAMAMQQLQEWNQGLSGKGSLGKPELDNIMKKYGKYSYNFCKDDLSLEFCCKSKECQYWQAAEGTKDIESTENNIKLLDQFDHADKSDAIQWNSIFPGLRGIFYPQFGHIGTIGAASGVGKTEALLTLMLENSHVYWIFWSYEQPIIELMGRARDILGLNGVNNWMEILHEKTKHIFFIRNGSICLQDQMIIKRNLEQIHNIRIKAMGSDYMGIIPVRNLDTGKIMNNEENSIPAAAKIIKDEAFREQVCHFVTVQPTKEYSAHGALLLEPEHIKYGQSIQSMSDGQVTLSRPNILKDNDCMCAFETKSRGAKSRSISVVELKDNHIIMPILYTKPFKLFRTIEEWNKALKAL